MTMPFGICSDNHLHNWSAFSSINADGLNNRLAHILDEIATAAIQVQANGGKRLYFAGDLFHVRGSVSPTVLNPAIDLFKKITGLGVQCRILTGNHDLESRDSEALSSACETLRTVEGVDVVSEPKLFADDKVAMIPWYDSMDRVRAEIESIVVELGGAAHEWTLIIHAPVNGVIAGLPDHGFWSAELAKYGFKRVFSGHYHNYKSFPGNVYSVGASTHQTWNDVNTLAGFLIVDDKTVSWIESGAPKFIDYNASWDDDQAIEHCKGNYVRVRLGEATDEEVTFIRDHVMALGAAGCVVQAIPTPKTAATSRSTTVSSAMTTRQSISEWIKTNAGSVAGLETLCDEIMNEVEAVAV
ncbi:Calcineurin-like phosphoesterase superfamily domain [Ectopseudomonas mendocina]|uniref:Calcineurin-like phosphoesterase superfamily domain n=1 Tax=Ectopseudomonas mendocina TaxID=300 RepID=A0A379PPC6_ECTME|nr:metallophosphoesterase [Pseudomonas mendocina]SUE95853.1 Calcineurin-like phosphoesterase superfamily domain [Pseudomonas mendocina]